MSHSRIPILRSFLAEYVCLSMLLVIIAGSCSSGDHRPPDMSQSIVEVDEPSTLVFEAGIADGDFTPDPTMPASTNHYSFTARDGGTQAVYLSTYPTAEALETALEMGVSQGTASAIDQIDDLVKPEE